MHTLSRAVRDFADEHNFPAEQVDAETFKEMTFDCEVCRDSAIENELASTDWCKDCWDNPTTLRSEVLYPTHCPTCRNHRRFSEFRRQR